MKHQSSLEPLTPALVSAFLGHMVVVLLSKDEKMTKTEALQHSRFYIPHNPIYLGVQEQLYEEREGYREREMERGIIYTTNICP